MNRPLVSLGFVFALSALGCAGAPPPASASPTKAGLVAPSSVPARAPDGEVECAVWARETSFAKSVEAHDAKAFAEHVHAAAVFVDGDGSLLRGRDAVVESWKTLLAGQPLRIVWRPTHVARTGDGNVVLSRGPYFFEDVRPAAKHRFHKGTFQSIWVRDDAGVFRVTVDGGTAAPVPATEEEITKLEVDMRAQCPRN